MAKIFLDTNAFIDLVEGRGNKDLAQNIDQQVVYISPLSTHIMFYVEKKTVPNHAANATISQFRVVDFARDIHDKSLEGPTPDYEDNIQLHSAAEADCDYFLTNDKKLLKMRFFGKTQIIASIPAKVPVAKN